MGGTGGWNSAPYNEARDTIAETDCDHTGAHVFDSIDKMRACGFTNPADIYSECLALQHPDRIGDSERWNIRGTICSEVKRQMGAQTDGIQRHTMPHWIG